MNAEERLRKAATTFNYSKMLSREEFDRLLSEVKDEAHQAGYEDARDWYNIL